MNEALAGLALRFGLVLLRVGACVIALPVLGPLPNLQVRASITLVLSLILTSVLLPVPLEVPESLLPLVVDALGEVIIGLAIGVCARLILLAGEFAGQIISTPMGMDFMQIVDPMSGGQQGVMSQYYLTLTVLLYVILGGHHSVIYGLVSSYRAWPLGAGIPSGSAGWFVSNLAGSLLRSGISLAAPVLVSILAVKVGLGIVSRAAPKVQVFFIGFSLAIIVGLLVLIVTAPETISLLSGLTRSLEGWLDQLFLEAQLER